MRHRTIGIVGVPYCGSTLLCTMLDACGGAHAAGEVNALTQWRGPDGQGEPPHCANHGGPCLVWTEDRLQARVGAAGLYEYVAGVLGLGEFDALVLSLKYPHLYEQFGRPDVGVVLYRRPEANAWSAYKHEGTPPEAYYGVWSSMYRRIDYWTAKLGARVFVSYEALAANPDAVLDRLARKLALTPHTPPFDLSKREDHQIGGNSGVMDRGRTVRLDDRWRSQTLAMVPGPVLETYDMLEAQCLTR